MDGLLGHQEAVNLYWKYFDNHARLGCATLARGEEGGGEAEEDSLGMGHNRGARRWK